MDPGASVLLRLVHQRGSGYGWHLGCRIGRTTLMIPSACSLDDLILDVHSGVQDKREFFESQPKVGHLQRFTVAELVAERERLSGCRFKSGDFVPRWLVTFQNLEVSSRKIVDQ